MPKFTSRQIEQMMTAARQYIASYKDQKSPDGQPSPASIAVTSLAKRILKMGKAMLTQHDIVGFPIDSDQYRAVYTIDVNGDTPRAAAAEAFEYMRDPASEPPVIDVIDFKGQVTRIDLSKEPT